MRVHLGAGKSAVEKLVNYVNSRHGPSVGDAIMSHPAVKKLMSAEQHRVATWQEPQERYLSLTGEVEARLAQRRAAMTPQELRAKPPWTMFPIVREQQIVIPQSARQNP